MFNFSYRKIIAIKKKMNVYYLIEYQKLITN